MAKYSNNLELNSHIFLIGFMGAGKSTIATQLKKMLPVDQMEMDETIAREEGMSIPDIFAKHGESYFRDLETTLLKDLVVTLISQYSVSMEIYANLHLV